MADITNKIVLDSAFVKLAESNGAASGTIDCTGLENIGLIVRNSDASAATITIKASSDRGALRRGLGDLTVALAQNEQAIIMLETARFKDMDDNDIDFTITDADGTAFSGTVTNVKLQGLTFKTLR